MPSIACYALSEACKKRRRVACYHGFLPPASSPVILQTSGALFLCEKAHGLLVPINRLKQQCLK
ncbi:MAG: hypothetical protein ACTS73_02870 [Arsenophonus sp. NEOnobi-MAG3]